MCRISRKSIELLCTEIKHYYYALMWWIANQSADRLHGTDVVYPRDEGSDELSASIKPHRIISTTWTRTRAARLKVRRSKIPWTTGVRFICWHFQWIWHCPIVCERTRSPITCLDIILTVSLLIKWRIGTQCDSVCLIFTSGWVIAYYRYIQSAFIG